MDRGKSPPSISTRGLSRRLGGRLVVDGLDLDVRPGSITGLLGPNGAGKTTAMRMVAGVLRPTSGRALVAGLDVWAEPIAAKARIGYLPESLDLYDSLTVGEFLRFIARAYGADAGAAEGAVGRWEVEFGLSALDGEFISDLSKGFRQRVSLAAVFVHEPDVLVLDEPLINLDPAASRRVKDLLTEGRRGRAALVSTHLADAAQEVCDRIVVMDLGRVLAQGSVQELAGRRRGGLEEAFIRLVGESGP